MSRGWSAAGAPREVEGEFGAREGRRVRVGAASTEVTAPSVWLEEATGEGTPGGAIEVLKILAKRDPRSNTVTFMSQPWKCCPCCCCCGNLKATGSRASGLHPLHLAGIRGRRPQAVVGVLGTRYSTDPWASLVRTPRRGTPGGAQPRTTGDRSPNAQVFRWTLRLGGRGGHLCTEQTLCPGAARPRRATALPAPAG